MIDGDGTQSLSAGELVTFQLYWSSMQGAYKGLMDVITSFTRAAGAASRVFSLMDSMPDIDADAGTHISNESIVGDFRLDAVHFYYPMRPKQPVLQGVDLHIHAGQTCALVGKSGGGKQASRLAAS